MLRKLLTAFACFLAGYCFRETIQYLITNNAMGASVFLVVCFIYMFFGCILLDSLKEEEE